MQMKKTTNNRGITLIALVVTIIILLILSSVTIATLTGENGLFARTKQAKLISNYTSAKEVIELKLMEIKSEFINEDCKITDIFSKIAETSNIIIDNYYTSETAMVKEGIESDVSKITNLSGILVYAKQYPEYIFLIGKMGTIDGILDKNEIVQLEDFEKIVLGKKDNENTENTEKIKNGFIPKINKVNKNRIEVSVESKNFDFEGKVQKYEYHIGNNKYESEENKYEITNLESNKEYPLYIIVYNENGNYIQSRTVYIEIEGTITDLTSKGISDNTAENGKIFSNNNIENAYLAFDKNTSTYWDGGNIDSFIGYEFNVPVEINNVIIKQPYINDVIKDFKIQYSDDNITYSDASEILTYIRGEGEREFELKENLGKHKYWRYQNLSGYGGKNYCAISELVFSNKKKKFIQRDKLTEKIVENSSEKNRIFSNNNIENAYLAFDKNTSTYWDGGNINSFLGYEFDTPVEVNDVIINQPYRNDVIKDFKIQYSDDNIIYNDASEILTYNIISGGEQKFELKENLGKHKYWRYQNLSGYGGNTYCAIRELEFCKKITIDIN